MCDLLLAIDDSIDSMTPRDRVNATDATDAGRSFLFSQPPAALTDPGVELAHVSNQRTVMQAYFDRTWRSFQHL
jgi:hypothetical protein